MNNGYFSYGNGGGGGGGSGIVIDSFADTLAKEEDVGSQLWDKLQELLPGTKTECPIRKKIEVQPLDPYDMARSEIENYGF